VEAMEKIMERKVNPRTPLFLLIDTPRTLTILGGMLLVLVYVALTPEVDDTTTNVKL
jgi:hypothetical protein